MSQHSSLKGSKGDKKLRSVLKRYERFLAFKEKGILKDDSSVFGMPKLKIVRTKIRKEKAEEKPEAAPAGAVSETESAVPKGLVGKPKAETAAPKEMSTKSKKEEKAKK